MLGMYQHAAESISVRWWDFHPSILGLYWHPLTKSPIIALNNRIEHNSPLLRTIMAEELGHHFTTTGAGLYRTFCHYRNRLEISKIGTALGGRVSDAYYTNS
jgi:hypothetical protein